MAALSAVPRHARTRMEVFRLGAHPSEEAGQRRITSQVLDIRQAARDLGLAVAGMDRAVADLMQADRAAMDGPFQLRREVVTAGASVSRDGALAKWTHVRLRRVRRRLALAGSTSQALSSTAISRDGPGIRFRRYRASSPDRERAGQRRGCGLSAGWNAAWKARGSARGASGGHTACWSRRPERIRKPSR